MWHVSRMMSHLDEDVMDRMPYTRPLAYDDLSMDPCRASYTRIIVGTRDGQLETGTASAKRGRPDTASYVDSLPLSFHLHAAYLDPTHGAHPGQRLAAAGHLAYFPGFRGHLDLGVLDYSLEPAFIRKRNERERHRVRCVNEGYARLRERLPRELEDKRLSKVETLRAAIDYIKHLQGLLDFGTSGAAAAAETPLGDAPRGRTPAPQRTECNSDGESKTSLSDCGENAY